MICHRSSPNSLVCQPFLKNLLPPIYSCLYQGGLWVGVEGDMETDRCPNMQESAWFFKILIRSTRKSFEHSGHRAYGSLGRRVRNHHPGMTHCVSGARRLGGGAAPPASPQVTGLKRGWGQHCTTRPCSLVFCYLAPSHQPICCVLLCVALCQPPV